MARYVDLAKLLQVTPGKVHRYFYDETLPGQAQDRRSFVSNSEIKLTSSAMLKIHFRIIRVSRTCKNYVTAHFENDILLKLKWNIFGFEEVVTSPERLYKKKAQFDYTTRYKIEIDDQFLLKVDQMPLMFELHAVDGITNKELLLSKSKYVLENILERNNHKQELRVYFCNSNVDSISYSIAILSGWYKLMCNPKFLNTLVTKRSPTNIATKRNKSRTPSQPRNTVIVVDSVEVTNTEIENFQDGLFLVLNRNKVLKTTQSEISLELKDRVKWLQYEANWKQTLKENAILKGKDPDIVHWRQWREEDTANVKLRSYTEKPVVFESTLTITIERLWFYKGSSPYRNEWVQQVFIEFTFLEQEGPHMESPVSHPKPTPNMKLPINFSRSFDISTDTSPINCKMLADAIRDGANIKFIIMNEPIENAELPIQTCSEVGYAEVDLHELVQLEENEDTFDYEIVDCKNHIEVIGFLTVKFVGILAMRRMALLFMAPEDFKLHL